MGQFSASACATLDTLDVAPVLGATISAIMRYHCGDNGDNTQCDDGHKMFSLLYQQSNP